MKKLVLFSLFLFFFVSPFVPLLAEERWQGIDESVLERFAQERGREAAEPFLDVEGDLLLFLFTVAGAVGGFIMGYYCHKVFVAGKNDRSEE
jgi:cobalt/nickel transport protein